MEKGEINSKMVEYQLDITPEEIKLIRSKTGLSQKDFGELIGVSKESVINYEKGKSSPRDNTIINIRKVEKGEYPADSVEQHSTIVREPDAHWVEFSKYMMVPLVNHRAQAGFLAGWGDPEYIDALPKVPWEVDREYKGRYVCFEVNGDSMDNNTPEALLDGDVILCREVQRHLWQNKLHINQYDFVIVHRHKGIVVKRITQHDTETGELTLHSLNDMYEDYSIHLNDCIAIFNVIDVKRSRRR